MQGFARLLGTSPGFSPDQSGFSPGVVRIFAEPVAAHFGFPDIVATELQLTDGRFTGEVTGTCCVGLGKIKHLQAYCTAHDVEAADVWYYGDSVADIQVLSAVGHPVAVNPMPELRQEAAQRNWPIIEF